MAFPPSSNAETTVPPFKVEDDKYADLRFHDNSPRPVPRPRKCVNYSDVFLPGTNTQSNSHHSSRDPTTDTVPTLPDNVDALTTPPPVPARNNDTVTRMPPTSNTATPLDLPQLPPSNPFAPLPPLPNPFLEPSADNNFLNPPLDFSMDEFPSFDDDIPLWEDASLTAMVYDNPPLPPKLTSTQQEPIGIYNMDPQSSLEKSEDVTGGSAYEDATDIIRAAIERNKLGIAHEPSSVVSRDIRSPEFDLPLDDNKRNNEECPTLTDVDVMTSFSPGDSPYDFPTALQNHPKSGHKRQPSDTPKEDTTERLTKHVDEPPMELMTFASRKSREHSPSFERRNVPASDQPPLPERNPVNRSISLDPSRSRIDTSPPQFGTGRGYEPPLPPRNPPRVVNGQPQEPPLPPRNPTNRMSSSPGPPAPAALSQAGSRHNREQTVLELVQLGYSRSDVVKALAISQNNLDLARQILEGFSSRD